jgi:hypothetical protein
MVLTVLPIEFERTYGWPTAEMQSRGLWENFLIGIFFSITSGVVVGTAVTSGGVSSGLRRIATSEIEAPNMPLNLV